MPRDQLSNTFVSAILAQQTGVVVLNLLDIEHEDLETPIRIVNNTEDVLSGGNMYTAVGFEVIPPDNREGTPRGARLRIDNTSQWFTPTLRTLQGQFTVTIHVGYTTGNHDPQEMDHIEISYLPMQLVGIQADDTTVEGTLSYENLNNQPFPGDTFSPFEFQGLF